GTTFFTAKRVGEDGEEAEDAQLWALPVRGEARELASRPGGFGGLAVAGRHLVAELEVHSQAADETEHRELSSRRKDATVTAALLPDDRASAARTAAPAQGPSADGGSGPDDAAGTDEDAPAQVLHFRHVTMPAGRLESWSVDREGTRALVGMVASRHDLVGVPDLYLLDLVGDQPPRLLREATAEVEFGPGEVSPRSEERRVGEA